MAKCGSEGTGCCMSASKLVASMPRGLAQTLWLQEGCSFNSLRFFVRFGLHDVVLEGWRRAALRFPSLLAIQSRTDAARRAAAHDARYRAFHKGSPARCRRGCRRGRLVTSSCATTSRRCRGCISNARPPAALVNELTSVGMPKGLRPK